MTPWSGGIKQEFIIAVNNKWEFLLYFFAIGENVVYIMDFLVQRFLLNVHTRSKEIAKVEMAKTGIFK